MSKRISFVLLVAVAVMALCLVACDEEVKAPSAQQERSEEAARYLESGELPDIVNFIDRQNFVDWMVMSDDPTTILWCTLMPFGHEKITIPIVGKFTDSGKTPFPTKFAWDPSDGRSGLMVAEEADPFSMYGVSSEYQFGFDPAGNYSAFSASIPWVCYTEPKVFQRMESSIVMMGDPQLIEITRRAKEALAAGEDQRAIDILREAETTGVNNDGQ